ncbi:hypothetical protein Hanom_Chr16g01452211 [Helianthus anomalus]
MASREAPIPALVSHELLAYLLLRFLKERVQLELPRHISCSFLHEQCYIVQQVSCTPVSLRISFSKKTRFESFSAAHLIKKT